MTDDSEGGSRAGAEETPVSSDVAFSPAVKAQQEKRGSRGRFADLERRGGWETRISQDLATFISRRESFYFATANAEGQPYIQHRGGPPGFLQVLDDTTLGFADFAGNQQYITLGNLSENDKAQIFLIDYANLRRVKIWGRARVVEDDGPLLTRLSDPAYAGRPERCILFDVNAWDVNCPQHITRRFSEAELTPSIQRLHQRIADLEAEIAVLRADGGKTGDPT